MNPLGSLTGRLAAEGVNYAPEIVSAAQRHGVDPTLLAAVAAQETGGPGSNGGRNEVGDGGHGHGLFQIDDRWHDFAKVGAAMDPAQNADYAAGMLSGLLQRYHGDVHEALSAYNSGDPHGAGTSTTWGDGKTLDYADSALRHYQQLQPTGASMSFNPIGAVTDGLAGVLGGLFGGQSSASSATSGLDPESLESALSQQSSAFTNINTLSSLSQSAPQSNNLLASLIDGDDSDN